MYIFDCTERKAEPMPIVRWMRRNFGERGHGWDFSYSQSQGSRILIEIWEPKYQTMYEMWYE